MSNKTNVLLIEVDQMPWFTLSCTGNENVRTPNLDRLIADGVLFNNATTQNPICLPSRVSMLSGQYPTKTRQFGFAGDCSRDIEWIHNTFKKDGYKTGAFGKFHCVSVGYDAWDFDVSAPTLPEENDLSRPPGNNYMNYCREHNVPWPTDQMHGHDPYNGVRRKPSSASPDMHVRHQQACTSDVPLKHGLEHYTTEQCLSFIKDCDDPFFAWLTFDRPHFPTALPAELAGDINPESVILDSNIPSFESIKTFFAGEQDYFLKGMSIHNMNEGGFRFLLATYFRLIEYIDSEIGRVVDFLKENNLYDNTSIFFTADHGDEAGNLGLFDKHRGCKSEAITRIPIIIKPVAESICEAVKGNIVAEPIENVDIFPTACALAGINPPSGVQGADLCGFLNGHEVLDPLRPVFCEEYYKRMIKKGHWRLVFDVDDDDKCLLHSLKDDPKQLNNLYKNPEYKLQRIELKRDLFAFLSGNLNGGYSDADVDRVKRGLADDGDYLPLHTINQNGHEGAILYCFRAAAIIRHEHMDYELLVPFYPDGNILLFKIEQNVHEQKNNYRRRKDAIKFDEKVVETFLDCGLRYIMDKVLPISILHPHKY
jgi:arylsulfatase A-like enzyme